MLHSEEGVWAEGRPVLCLWSQGDSNSLATCAKGRRVCPQRPNRNSQKQPHGETGREMPSSTKIWQRWVWQGFAWEGVEKVPHSSPSQYRGRVQGSCRLPSPVVKRVA